jgi:gliding motility-associated-like protein
MYQITGLSSDHPLYWGLVWSNEPGCNADTSQFTNILLEDNSSICFPSLIIPAAISPDQDGYNDYWEIEGLADFKNYKVVVFNQNGQEMYTVHNELPHWDGTWRGVPLPNGDYYYSLYFEDIGKSIFGTVSLKR